MRIVVWIVTGVVLSVIARAVSPERQAPGIVLSTALGIVGGGAGGLLISWLAERSVAGFTAGFVGSIIGASVLLVIGSVVTAPGGRTA